MNHEDWIIVPMVAFMAYYILFVADTFEQLVLVPVGFVIVLFMLDIVLDAITGIPEPKPIQPRHSDIEFMNTEKTCTGCGEEFDTSDGHVTAEIGDDYYCENCSKVAQIVMEEYQEWFQTTKDVREDLSS